MSAKEMPDCPRPATKEGLAEKVYLVRDRAKDGPPKVWETGLTYDQAWKLKQKLAGERKSITARVEHMAKFAEHAAKAKLSGPPRATAQPAAKPTPPKTYSLDEANASALAAARGAITTPVVAPTPAPIPVDDLFSDDELDALTSNDDVDALIDAANSEDSDAPAV